MTHSEIANKQLIIAAKECWDAYIEFGPVEDGRAEGQVREIITKLIRGDMTIEEYVSSLIAKL